MISLAHAASVARVAVGAALLVSMPVSASRESGAPPVPVPAVAAIVGAFPAHSVVAIAESRHAVRQAGDFYVTLVRDAAFQRAVNDIVIEFASGQSQPLLDRYVVAGDSLPPDSLRSIWRNTTKAASWEAPVYASWLAAIRDVNRKLPPSRRIRVLAGDTPIDWSRMERPSDWAALGPNDVSFARVITDGVLARGRKALVVLGSSHLTRGGARDGSPNTTTRVERRYPGALYVVYLYTGRPGGESADARIASEAWANPSLVPLRGHWAGALPAGARPLEGLADALLYVGPSSTLEIEEAPATSFEPAYLAELDRRSFIEWSDSTRARRFLGLLPKK